MAINCFGASLYNKSTDTEPTYIQNPNKNKTCGIETLSQVSSQFYSNNKSIQFKAKVWEEDKITQCRSALLKDPDIKIFPEQLNEWLDKFIRPKSNSPEAWARAVFGGIFTVKNAEGKILFQGKAENANGPDKEKRLAEIEALLVPYLESLPLGKEFPFDTMLLLPTSMLEVYHILAFKKRLLIRPFTNQSENHQVCITVGESTNQIEFIKNSFIVDAKCRFKQIFCVNYKKEDPSQVTGSLEFSYSFEEGIEENKQQQAQEYLNNLALIFKALAGPSLVLK